MTVSSETQDFDAVVTEELIGIVIRAGELGYPPWRVGIALRVPPIKLAWICAHLNAPDPRKILTPTLRTPSRQEHGAASTTASEEDAR